MSLTKELRVSLDEVDHAFLSQEALAVGGEMQAIVRALIREHIKAKRHEITVLARFMESEGIVAASHRNGDGVTA